ncbi:sigma 54-interacting transcriptional regulator [Tepidanaerobacter sp. EBM-49]|uniref:sigma-54 interaction domain-containing protein n=1 Tax=Tepidanaerobacter sp. EBM-49 TaxID=1918504 RepID=UPI002580F625|nr:sigma 54-interacting transcriptional regulator [Tepidanaerobacter sp. EBM-49]
MNISKKNKELEGLKIKNHILETIFEDASECIVVVDAEGYILMLSQTYANFLGITPQEAIGKHVTEVIENTRLHIVVKTGEREVGQIQRIGGNDAVTMRIPIIENGKVFGAIGKVMYKDVREVEVLCKQLEAAKRDLDLCKEQLKKVTDDHSSLDKIIGNSKKIKELKYLVTKIAKTDSTVLITGESGTGKEVFANTINNMSNRKNNNFIKVNCAAIPENILESELFGYVEGAFTGAKRNGKIGKFEMADHGTIFLDEIGDMGLEMQAKILRVLQEKEIERIGGNITKKIDVRIIAATNQNLQEKMQSGKFREDLFYRLNVVSLELPPLREIPEDIPVLCEHFLKNYNTEFGIYIEKINNEAMQYLQKYSWPGNVRELKNTIERVYNFVTESTIKAEHLPKEIINSHKFTNNNKGSLDKAIMELEMQKILDALKSSGGNKSKAAKLLGINRAGLYQKLKKYNINY